MAFSALFSLRTPPPCWFSERHLLIIGSKSTLTSSLRCNKQDKPPQGVKLPTGLANTLNDIQNHVVQAKLGNAILGEVETKVWRCYSWMFPQHTRAKFESSASPAQAPVFSASVPIDSLGFQGATLLIADCALPQHMQEIWENSSFQICADGGANRLFDWAKATKKTNSPTISHPAYIVGDLDGLRNDVKEHFESKVCFPPPTLKSTINSAFNSDFFVLILTLQIISIQNIR